MSLIFTMLFEALLVDGEFHIGSIIGGFLVILGIYITLWGKQVETFAPTNVQESQPNTTIEANTPDHLNVPEPDVSELNRPKNLEAI
ncbi:hypothetical protein V6N12_047235 [Hibiscus sabdariffa]|uniref:WAT1-related protein n=1 Tax=Hibiscus sabdariffa TaxID=183260 RepID=A0ABR2DAA2_9ROSI